MPSLLQHDNDYRYKPDLVIHSKMHGMVEEPEVPGHHLEDAKAQRLGLLPSQILLAAVLQVACQQASFGCLM